MITFYLIRHASYTEKYNVLPGRLPVELSDKGLQEANKLKKYFEDKNISKIYSSAVLRCKQTAEIISDGKIPITYDKRLLEALSAFQGYWKQDWNQYWIHTDELGGETPKDLIKRSVDFFENTSFDENKNYVICSHMDPLFYIYQRMVGANPIPEVKPGEDSDTSTEFQERASIRIIKKEGENYNVVTTLSQDNL